MCSGPDNKGIPSTGFRTASSIVPTIFSREATRASDWNAGKCALRAMPPRPTSTPRYTRSGELRMNLRLALVRQNQADHHEIERPNHDPAVRRRPSRHRGDREQEEANVLRDPRAALDDGALPFSPRQLDRY